MNYWATEYLRTKTASWAGRALPPFLLGHFPAAWATEGGYQAGVEKGVGQLDPDTAAQLNPDTFPYAGLGHGLAQMARVALPAAVGGAIGHSIDSGGHGAMLGMLGGGVAASPWLYSASKSRGMADVDKAVGALPVDDAVPAPAPQMTPEQVAAFHQELLSRLGQSRDPDVATYHAMMAENPDMGRVQTVEQSAPDYGAKLRALMERRREPA